ncbi:MAG: hypothetical protein MJK10_10780 [Pseudomonadales bacterium]|nr:hypothetical protein [Pseudomonadales bacterium]NRA16484.1 methylamine utilization protein MauG [Oceanospirillaceae bacterium]
MLSSYKGSLAASVLLLAISSASNINAETTYKTKAALGSALYFDRNLSLQRNQSCASCHAPERGFIDNRENPLQGAVSIGADGKSIGDRHAPTTSYASFSPDFYRSKSGEYTGGQFHDGRAANLQAQAGGPPLNPGEMAMVSKDAVLLRLLENSGYRDSFAALFNQQVLTDAEAAYTAMTESIASFEKTDFFSPFDSKYDRYLKGQYTMTEQEQLGETLFFSQQFSNCNLCHQLRQFPGQQRETFSNYQYRNIGVPVNRKVREANGSSADYIDHGLLQNPLVKASSEDGKFKVPTLRNVAITAPYMHNGVFADLKTVVLFYDKYNSRKKSRQINPETHNPWAAPEVPTTVALTELKKGRAFTDQRIDALVAFMKTLTDKRFEHLLQEN